MSNVVVVINDQGARRIVGCLDGWQEKNPRPNVECGTLFFKQRSVARRGPLFG